jgi:hypothetical protein
MDCHFPCYLRRYENEHTITSYHQTTMNEPGDTSNPSIPEVKVTTNEKGTIQSLSTQLPGVADTSIWFVIRPDFVKIQTREPGYTRDATLEEIELALPNMLQGAPDHCSIISYSVRTCLLARREKHRTVIAHRKRLLNAATEERDQFIIHASKILGSLDPSL